jgi:uncharacterized OsmC-like protein
MQVVESSTIRNGVDTQQLFGTLDAVKAQPELAAFTWRATNEWLAGAHNRSTIKDFYAASGEDTSRAEAFTLDAGEPAILCGTDTGPNPAEYLLHALAACLTTSLVYVAAARKVPLTRVESRIEGDMDVRGALGLDDSVPNRFTDIRITFTVEGDAPAEKLREVVTRARARSAVFDTLTHGVPVHVSAVTP